MSKGFSHTSDKCQHPYFIEEIETQRGKWLVGNFTITKWPSQALTCLHGPFILTCISFLTGRDRTTVERKHGCGFSGWLFNRSRGGKQTKLCWECFSVRIPYIATHTQKLSGLCDCLNTSNTCQVENELLAQANYLRLLTIFSEANGHRMWMWMQWERD